MSKNNMELGIESVNYEGQAGQGNKDIYKGRKKKYGRTYINILHDPRVVRGNTYAAFVIPSSLQMEFIRLKEEEQRRKRLMNIPKRLPRVAHLGKKKTKEDSYFEDQQQEEERPESPLLKRLDDPEYIEDRPYFYEDRPPTPVYVPKPPGVEIATQIEDGELFDFDLEVEPILEVLIGRSLVQATYELIEEHEREEYLSHKKHYEQKREFELINLQRMEAARIRREQEKDRRHNQTVQKKLYDTSSQKKLISKLFAKNLLRNMDKLAIKELNEIGFLKENFDMKLSCFVQRDLFPVTNKLIFTNNELKQLVSSRMLEMKKKDLAIVHKDFVLRETERIKKIKEDLENQKLTEIENEKKRLREKAERKENRRINRITTNINENIISTKDYKQEVASISLCDIDDFSLYSERIHATGGLFGLVSIILDELLKVFNLTENTQENINFISSVLDEFIFKCLKENQSFEIKYLESERFNFSEISEERRPEFIDFIHDYKRFVNKSLKILIDKAQLPSNTLDLVLSALVSLYFKDKSSIPVVEVSADNQDPEYIEKIKQEQEDYADNVARLESVKKKIKFVMIKPSVLKKRRDNMAAFIQVAPSLSIKETLIETDEIPASERPKTTTAANQKSDDNLNNAGAGGNNNEEGANAENAGQDNNAENNNIGEDNQENSNQSPEKNNNENANPDVKEDQIEKDPEGDRQGDEAEGENVEENAEEKNAEGNQANTDLDGKAAESAAADKSKPKVFKFDYFNEAQVFKNSNMKYEPYIIHHKLHEYSLINVAKSFRRVVKKNLKIDTDLNELIDVSNSAYDKYTQFVVEWILNNEIYIKDKIVPISAGPLETKIEEISVPASAMNNNPENQVQLENPVNAENPGTNEEPQAAQE